MRRCPNLHQSGMGCWTYHCDMQTHSSPQKQRWVSWLHVMCVQDRPRKERLCAEQLAKPCLHHFSWSHIIYHLWLEKVSVLQPVHRQCLEMGQLVLSSFLSPLVSGSRKFKSNITGCTSCFSQLGHREGCGEKHGGTGQRKRKRKEKVSCVLRGSRSPFRLERKSDAKSVFSQCKNSYPVASSKGVGNSMWETLW